MLLWTLILDHHLKYPIFGHYPLSLLLSPLSLYLDITKRLRNIPWSYSSSCVSVFYYQSSFSVVTAQRPSRLHSACKAGSRPASNWLRSSELSICEDVPRKTILRARTSCAKSQKRMFFVIRMPRRVIRTVSTQSDGKKFLRKSAINCSNVRVRMCSLSVAIQSRMWTHLKAPSITFT